jgi:hypothetical protein
MNQMRFRDTTKCVVIQPLEPRRFLSAYFVDAASGNDTNSGRSARAAWQTLAAVNGHSFKRGDSIFLTGTFSKQSLVLGKNATGIGLNTYEVVGARKAVKVGVLDAAVVADTDADGIDISTSDVTIQNISITADPAAASSGNYHYGIYLHNTTSVAFSHVVINHVSATGFSYSGLCMQGWNTSVTDSAGFADVLIENSSFYANQVSGIFVGAGDSTGNEFQPTFPADFYANDNLTIRNCQAYDNPGYNGALMGTPDGVNINQGNFTAGGIFISSVKDATVQNCTVYNNCFASAGSVGLWAFDATRVVFQDDESYDNKTVAGDGDGFDFDHGVTHSLMQYDYSHGNEGSGFQIVTYGGSSTNDGDTIRYCIANDNATGIWFGTPAGVPVIDANIYNNTVLQSDSTAGLDSVAMVLTGDATASDSVNILNNIFYSAGADPLVYIQAPGPGIRFERNDYWLAGSPSGFDANLGGMLYTSFATWSAATDGLETLDGKSLSLIEDPQLKNEAVTDLPVAGVGSLELSGKSPLRLAGLNLAARQWAGTAPYDAERPYGLAGAAWGGLGRWNYFGRPINRRGIGAG